MKPTPDILYAQALELSADDRAGLIDRLASSLEPPADPALEAAQVEECESRLAAHRRGELHSLPGESLFRKK